MNTSIDEIRSKIGGANGIVKLAGVVFLVGAPFLLGKYYIGLLTLALIYGLFALSLDLIWGYADVLSFGHAAFFGLGAYLMAKILETFQVEGIGYLGMIAGTVVPGIVGLTIAALLLYRGITEMYFTIITLAIAIIAQQAVSSWSYTGGFDGIIGIPIVNVGIPGVAMVEFTGLTQYYGMAALIVLSLLISNRIISSKFGTALIAIRENKDKARALGYDIERYQTLIFGISCMMAGFAGTLYTAYSGQVTPQLLGFLLSTNLVLWVLIGGRGTLVGPVVGVVFFFFVRDFISSMFSGTWQLFIGLMLIVFVLWIPQGILGLYQSLIYGGPREFIRGVVERPA